MVLNSQKSYGLLFVALLATVSYFVVYIPWMAKTGISSLVVAIVLGMFIGNIWHLPHSYTPGIQYAAKQLLRLSIILYGFRISFQQMVALGMEAFVLDCLVVTLTLIVGYFVGRKLLKLDHELSLLISAGAAICGAAAVLAVESIIKSEPYKATVAIGTVVLFGTTSMFLYPFLQHAGGLGLTNSQFGLFAGASIHEVAQALVAGNNINPEVGQVAVIVKMIRVLLLVPVLFLFSMLNNRFSSQHKKSKLIIPWFAVFFVVMIGFHSLSLFPQSIVNYINQLDIFLLTMAMGAIGIETKWNKIKTVGLKPLYLAIILFIWLAISVDGMVRFI